MKASTILVLVALLEFIIPTALAFQTFILKGYTRECDFQKRCSVISSSLATNSNEQVEEFDEEHLDPLISSQFTIKICSSTTCAKKANSLGLDDYHVLSGLYSRKEGAGASQVEVEESSCLGCCKFAPCVGIEHEDYVGTVSLEGMGPNEFSDSV